MSRNYNDELQFLDKINKNCWRIKKGFVPNMQVSGGSGLRSCRPRLRPAPGGPTPAEFQVFLPRSDPQTPRARATHTRTDAAGASRVFSPRTVRQDVFLVFRDFHGLFPSWHR